jgi:outer membrane translocation and assembly module TamA
MPALTYAPDLRTRISVGPLVRYVSTVKYAQAGAALQVIWDRATRTPMQQKGLSLQFGLAGYPDVLDVRDPLATADALARFYVPVAGATIAVRAGGRRVWGENFPLWDAAFVGGGTTLRGFAWNRFAGDAAAFGGAELRVPLARITLLTRGELGLMGLTDAGRVWNDGVSEGDWHTSVGGGLFFGSLGQAVSLTYAKGETNSLYLSFGLPF